jgi:hypothetical protein
MRISFGQVLIAVTTLTAAVLPVTAAAANAAPADRPANPPAVVTSHHDPKAVVQNTAQNHPAPHRTTTLATSVPHATIRTMTSTERRSRTIVTLHAKGSRVDVSCYLAGDRVSGDRTWYRTAAPKIGYIAGAQLAIRHEPALHVEPCSLNTIKANPTKR